MKIHTVAASFFHAASGIDGRKDRQTDMTRLTVAFRNFANALKNVKNKAKTVVPAGTY
jgi:hypothetical protein